MLRRPARAEVRLGIHASGGANGPPTRRRWIATWRSDASPAANDSRTYSARSAAMLFARAAAVSSVCARHHQRSAPRTSTSVHNAPIVSTAIVDLRTAAAATLYSNVPVCHLQYPSSMGVGSVDRPVVVIGAGPAGLTAAYDLTQRGVPTVVFESDAQVGGLAKTVVYRGFRFDIGGHRFFTKVSTVRELWHELLGADLLRRPRLSRIYYRGP